MTASPAEFTTKATGLQDGRPAPEEWTAAYGETDFVRVLAARSDSGRELQVLTVDADATASQRSAFERARSEWLTHDEASVIVSVVAHGDTPRPWLAIDPIPPSTAEMVRSERVRSLVIDLAEGIWLIESAGSVPLPKRDQLCLDAQTGSARVCWPIDPTRQSESDGVELVGAVGHELLTGQEPPSEGAPDWPERGDPPQLWRSVESALADDAPDSCYELKRALLFGPATPPVGTPEEPATARADESEKSPPQSLPGQASRRTVVGVIGLGVLGGAGLLARGAGTTNSEDTEPEGPPEASFEFEQGRTTMTVTHTGGDDIEAGQLVIKNTRISGTGTYRWTEFEAYDAETTVSEGDSIVVDRGVLSMWYASVVWVSPDGETEKVLKERSISEEDLYS